ncbi:hypothetical protein L7F22_042088 [Adiantum nelumboides]|nr:hypothetical protein [Adiantum nelumboides]
MSAHLQFGPEWMRKGAPSGKTPTTPTPSSESPFVFSDSPQTGAKSSTSSSAGRRNNSKEPTPAPVSSNAAPLPSPGGFSFAAAAGGAGSGSNAQQNSAFSSNGSILPSNLDGDGSRYSKRLLSLYSTEHGPKGIPTEPPSSSTERAPPTGPASFSGLNNRKKGFSSRESATGGGGSGGRRTHSINTDVANVYKDRSDSQRTGLFQRGNSNTLGANGTGNNPNNSPQHPLRDRHVSGGGIQGGVLAGVAPNSSRKTSGQMDEHQESEIRTPKRERLPGEGPIGPPTDRNGGFVKGFTTDRRRTTGPVPTPTKRSVPSPSIAANPDPVKESSGPQSTDVDLSHHATTLVESLKLDEDDEELVNRAERVDEPEWSAEQAEWFYRDPSGQVQGPFKASVMQEWFSAKYFNDDLLVRPAEATEFIPLGIMLRLIGDDVKPFLIAPSQYAAAKASQPAPAPAPPNHLNLLAHGPGSHNWHMQQQQSPFLVNPTLAGLAGQGNSSSPFGTPSSPFLDLHGSNSHQQQQQHHQQQQHAEFLMYQQRAMQEQRNAQMAALAMAQRSGDPSMMAAAAWNSAPQPPQQQPWGQSPQPQHAFAPEGGWGNVIQQQQPQQLPQQQIPQQDQFNLQQQQEVQIPKEQNFATQDVTEPVHQQQEIEDSSFSVKEASNEIVSAPSGKANQAEEAAVSVQEPKAEEAEQETSPEHLWPQSPSAVEFASEPAMEDMEPLPMTTVKGRKARRGETQKLSQAEPTPLREEEESHSAAAGNVKLMNESDFRKHQASLRKEERSNSFGSDSLSKNAGQSAATAKAAPWAGNSSSNGMSLRDIQEAEEKRIEALRARQQRPVAAVRGDSSGPATSMNKMTWGLASVPSSASNGGNASVSSPTTNAGPVWSSSTTTKAGTPKKTLTEIQEEERKRAQASAASSRSINPSGSQMRGGRGYADLASVNTSTQNTSVAADTPDAGSGWAVVGAGGGKPTAATQVSTPTRAIPGAASAISKSPMVRSTSSNASPVTANGQQVQPSAEFMKYCREQLKGLQIKVDDFIEMLLSFPLDPSPDVVEIIAESVYANSGTLDGRRFAADFVAKRKQDAVLQRRKGTTSSTANNVYANTNSGTANDFSTSTASPLRNASDVLKQPARTANSSIVGGGDAFGGFKVVKPKGGKKRV